MSDYFQRIGLSASTAKKLLVSPLQARWALDNPTKPSPAMQKGTRVHLAVLEPDVFASRCIAGPDLSGVVTKDGKPASNPAVTTEGKAILAAFAAANPGADVLTDSERAEVLAMRDSLLASEVGHLFPVGDNEHEVYWSRDGVDHKAKLDCLAPGCVVDVKTYGGEWTGEALTRNAFASGWHVQAAHYLEAARIAAHNGVSDFFFAIVQSVAPYEVAVLRCTPEFLARGVVEMDRARALWRDCVASGVWPRAQAAGSIGMDLGLPGWVR